MNKNCWQTPGWIFKKLNEMSTNWFDPFPPDYTACAMTYQWKLPAYCNPPYGRGYLLPFVRHASEQPVSQIWLVNTDHSTEWYMALCGMREYWVKRYLCLLNKRVAFINPDTGTSVKGNNRPQSLFGFFTDEAEACEFKNQFHDNGLVLEL